jgi:hypothetical protein
MAIVALTPGAIEMYEIHSLKILENGWEVVTSKEGKRFVFDGHPVWAENTKNIGQLIVDVRRGIVFIPLLKPIPHEVYNRSEHAGYKGREVIEKSQT